MRILVTTGPTREHIDTVRFITNASSGKMGCAVAEAAATAGHSVTLLAGAGVTGLPDGVEAVSFTGVDDLRAALDSRFDGCDALIMAAAVGDFRPEKRLKSKLSRNGGPITLRLIPTEDILAGMGERKRKGQTLVAFAVEDRADERAAAKARREMIRKNADFVVVNTPEAMSADVSLACILSRDGVALSWAERPKRRLAAEIVRLLQGSDDSPGATA